MKKPAILLSIAFVLSACGLASGEEISAVGTVFKLLSPTTKLLSRAYDDPRWAVSPAVLCVARQNWRLQGALGFAEDKSEASIACRQTGPIVFGDKPLDKQEEMFNERISLVFKKLRVIRMVDAKRNTLVYLTYSDRLIEGSPQNSVTAVAMPAGTVIPVK
ncbi:MAG: CreA family protein [Betaproteobacteria bacterium]|nr:CreA family protein [Betaproteobacteria bacterium]